MNRIEIKGDCEGTRAPWWLIIDPRQNFRTDNQALHDIAGMIKGPFFSRESAQEYLDSHRYNFGRNAHVFCHSGCYSREYCEAVENGSKESR